MDDGKSEWDAGFKILLGVFVSFVASTALFLTVFYIVKKKCKRGKNNNQRRIYLKAVRDVETVEMLTTNHENTLISRSKTTTLEYVKEWVHNNLLMVLVESACYQYLRLLFQSQSPEKLSSHFWTSFPFGDHINLSPGKQHTHIH